MIADTEMIKLARDVPPPKHVFGPVLSRRLGRSLGIDPILPKTCNWNCVYCQLGRTVPLRHLQAEYVPTDEILEEVENALLVQDRESVDWVTFVGSGEPLLHSNIGGLIRGVQRLTDLPVAVITNGALLSRPEVREELLVADAVLPTLDAGTSDLFRRINRSHPSISFQQHVTGLAAFGRQYTGRLLLEVMLVKDLNDSEEALVSIAELVAEIQPDEVHISLPERPPVEPWVQPADAEGIMRATAILGDFAKVLHPGEGVLVLDDPVTALDVILAVIGRHPLSESQLMGALAGQSHENRNDILENLENCGEAKKIRRQGCVFWVSSSARFPNS
jgi:wyosine [tRNA(Phe)-imidazoG37] synthetase (radical SAM superfamily)